jgi:hypothetical protein
LLSAFSKRAQTFANSNALEGYRPLANGRGLFVTSSRRDNLTVGRTRPAPSNHDTLQ